MTKKVVFWRFRQLQSTMIARMCSPHHLPHSFSVIGTVAGKTTSLILSSQVAVKEMKVQSATNLNKHCHVKTVEFLKKCWKPPDEDLENSVSYRHSALNIRYFWTKNAFWCDRFCFYKVIQTPFTTMIQNSSILKCSKKLLDSNKAVGKVWWLPA